MRPRVFIGSSAEQKAAARALLANIEDFSQAKVWDHDVFAPSDITVDALIEEANSTQFAIFLVTPDDKVTSRGKRRASARDNVIFELGMFMGTLGRRRAFLVQPRKAGGLQLPTDLMGINTVPYDSERTDGASVTAFTTASERLRKEISKELKSCIPSYLARYVQRVHPVHSSAAKRSELSDTSAYQLLLDMYSHETFKQVCTFDLAFDRWAELVGDTDEQTVNLSAGLLTAMENMFTERRCESFRRIMVVAQSALAENYALPVLRHIADEEKQWTTTLKGVKVATRVFVYPEAAKAVARRQIQSLHDFVCFEGVEGRFAVVEHTLGAPGDRVVYPMYAVETTEAGVSEKIRGFERFWAQSTNIDTMIKELRATRRRHRKSKGP